MSGCSFCSVRQLKADCPFCREPAKRQMPKLSELQGGTPIEDLQLPESLIKALRELGHFSIESVFMAALVSPEAMQKYVEAHLKPRGMLFSNFIAECVLHLSSAYLKYVAEAKHEERGTGFILDDTQG